ncbi:MAG: bifunctional phosphopantothenoylcysteine decarboxylase/phosphopantothenate--cysteine ligase CoaBC [Hyphomicrobium sp.]|nr:bifunctional phosphopantothenoylcysteine decarboxylase/phosphopantothenate--cysteine ligase CoaBC [Hyphomicrobium sp.]
MASTKRIVLIVGGGIAAYKSLDLIRRLRERGYGVRVIMTRAAQEFITPLSVAALSNERVFTELFDLDDEREIGHIRLARDTDLIIVAPATADLIAKMATGQANDLATAVLLATDKPIVVAPAMNPRMWLHPATRRNVAQIASDGATLVGPGIGEMAERGEAGPGRLAETDELIAAIEQRLASAGDCSGTTHGKPLTGRHVLVTSGPTHEPVDPVRYIANRSSGKQGHEIAAAAQRLGARVTLITGPVAIEPPAGVNIVRVVTADDMLNAVHAALPADIAVFAAAVADWRMAKLAAGKIKKLSSGEPPTIKLAENQDILKSIGKLTAGRPQLVIGFAAETDNLIANAQKKLKSKSADWIVANDVSALTGVMGGDSNTVHIVSRNDIASWPRMSKAEVAEKLMHNAAAAIAAVSNTRQTAAE